MTTTPWLMVAEAGEDLRRGVAAMAVMEVQIVRTPDPSGAVEEVPVDLQDVVAQRKVAAIPHAAVETRVEVILATEIEVVVKRRSFPNQSETVVAVPGGDEVEEVEAAASEVAQGNKPNKPKWQWSSRIHSVRESKAMLTTQTPEVPGARVEIPTTKNQVVDVGPVADEIEVTAINPESKPPLRPTAGLGLGLSTTTSTLEMSRHQEAPEIGMMTLITAEVRPATVLVALVIRTMTTDHVVVGLVDGAARSLILEMVILKAAVSFAVPGCRLGTKRSLL